MRGNGADATTAAPGGVNHSSASGTIPTARPSNSAKGGRDTVDTVDTVGGGRAPRSGAGAGPCFLPVLDDTLAPALRPGDFVAVLPVAGYRGAGCYAVRSPVGTVEFVVVQGIGLPDALHVCRANRVYGPGDVIALATFADVVLGKVAAECRVTDRALLREARLGEPE